MPGVDVCRETKKRNKASKSSHSAQDASGKKSDKSKNSLVPLTLKSVGHVLKEGEVRSQDVSIQEDVHFADMYFKEEVLAGLHSTGFMKPSPVQLQAIPTGCCGLDLIVQAKSGTGKTCVFTVVALEMVATSAPTCQVLVVAPTREIAVQIASVISSVGRHMAALRVQTFIGGTDVEKNISCHVAVGTPGRLHHLLSCGVLSSKNIRLLVFDEADQLLESFRNVVLQIVAALPLSKQIICTSATYTPSLQDLAKKIMRSPSHISLGSKQLLAVTQYVHKLPYTESLDKAFRAKLLHLKGILGSAVFNQCLIFTNSITRCESVYDSLHRDGWPVARLCGGQTQQQRLKALDDLTTHRCRVMVATDLAARGLDSPHVSLVVSLEPPPHPHTYLHRVGRAGRFGSKGLSVVLACQGDDWLHVQAIATVLDLTLLILPEPSLANNAEPLQHLPLLTPEQLQQWTLSTSHRLTYSSAISGGSYDPLEVWKMKSSNGLTSELPTSSITESNGQHSTPSDDHVMNDGSSSSSGASEAETKSEEVQDIIAASLPFSENKTTATSISISKQQSQENGKKHLGSENEQKICFSSDLNENCKNGENINDGLDLSSGLNGVSKNKENVHTCSEPENSFNEPTELEELAKIVHMEKPDFASSFSFSSIRAEVASLAADTVDEERNCATVMIGRTAKDPSEEATARLGVLLSRQHQRHAKRLSEMEGKWQGVTLNPREALTALQRGSTTDELLTQLQQSLCVTNRSTSDEAQEKEGEGSNKSSERVLVPESQSGPHQTDTFQFHLGVMMTEKQQEKLDKKKRASFARSRDKSSGDVNSPVCPQTQSKESEKSQRHRHGARKKEYRCEAEVVYRKGTNSPSHDEHYRSNRNRQHDEYQRGHMSPLVLFDRSPNFTEHSKYDGNRRSARDARCSPHSSQRAERERKARYPGKSSGKYKYKCEYEGCSRDAVVSDRVSVSSEEVVFSDNWNTYRDSKHEHGRKQKTHKQCKLCAQEQHVDHGKELKAYLDYYRRFALINYYVTVMGHTAAAAAARHCVAQYPREKSHIRCPECISVRRPRTTQDAEENSSDAGKREVTSRRGSKYRDERHRC